MKMEGINIYGDLVNVDLGKQIQKLELDNKALLDHIQELEKDISKLCTEILNMKEVQKNLTKNISELYNTAKSELRRKDLLIADLQNQLDDVLFRRSERHENINNSRRNELEVNNKRQKVDKIVENSPSVYRKINNVKSNDHKSSNRYESLRPRSQSRTRNRSSQRQDTKRSFNDNYRRRQDRNHHTSKRRSNSQDVHTRIERSNSREKKSNKFDNSRKDCKNSTLNTVKEEVIVSDRGEVYPNPSSSNKNQTNVKENKVIINLETDSTAMNTESKNVLVKMEETVQKQEHEQSEGQTEDKNILNENHKKLFSNNSRLANCSEDRKSDLKLKVEDDKSDLNVLPELDVKSINSVSLNNTIKGIKSEDSVQENEGNDTLGGQIIKTVCNVSVPRRPVKRRRCVIQIKD